MWRRLRNALQSVGTYADLSPDLQARRRVRQRLSDRPVLSRAAGYASQWQPLGIQPAIVDFVDRHLPNYSGLTFGQLRPEDRLEADLSWTAICGFDWEFRLCEDFEQCFGVDWRDRPEEFDPVTVADLLRLLQSLADPTPPLDIAEID